jgi:ADP-glucose pyrophosphorylase
VPIGIGAGSTISNTIVDKNARIGENCTIVNKEGIEEANKEDEGFYIRSGIVTVRCTGFTQAETHWWHLLKALMAPATHSLFLYMA